MYFLKNKTQGQTPLAVAELIKDIIQDKVVCDIGCGTGELLVEMSKYAKKVIGIEENHKWAKEAGKKLKRVNDKDFDIYVGNTFFQPLPEADVYYSWSKDSMGVYLKAQYEGTKGIWIFGISLRPSTKNFLENLGAEIRRLTDDPLWKVYIKYANISNKR